MFFLFVPVVVIIQHIHRGLMYKVTIVYGNDQQTIVHKLIFNMLTIQYLYILFGVGILFVNVVVMNGLNQFNMIQKVKKKMIK